MERDELINEVSNVLNVVGGMIDGNYEQDLMELWYMVSRLLEVIDNGM